jgi:hypothetical protein
MRHPDTRPPVFQAVTLSFTSDKLAAWFRSRADEITARSEAGLAKIPDMLKEVELDEIPREELAEAALAGVRREDLAEAALAGVRREDLVNAIKTAEQAEKSRVARAVEQLRFIADNLAPDAVFEIVADELLRFVTEIESPGHEPRLLRHSVGRLRQWPPRAAEGSVTKLAGVY